MASCISFSRYLVLMKEYVLNDRKETGAEKRLRKHSYTEARDQVRFRCAHFLRVSSNGLNSENCYFSQAKLRQAMLAVSIKYYCRRIISQILPSLTCYCPAVHRGVAHLCRYCPPNYYPALAPGRCGGRKSRSPAVISARLLLDKEMCVPVMSRIHQ